MSIEFHGENDKNYSRWSKEKTKWAITRFWVSIFAKKVGRRKQNSHGNSRKVQGEKMSKKLKKS
jgi:hypothetical protein